MSSIALVRDSQGVNNVNPTQDLQGNASLHGRVFHEITDGGKYIIQSINNIAQSVLSTCIRVVLFGCYHLDNLKSYLFSNQTALEGNETASSNNLPIRPAPPPPPSPPSDVNTLSSRLSTEVQSSFQESTPLNVGSADVRSNSNPAQDSPKKDDSLLEDDIHSRRSLSHEGSDPVIEEQCDNRSLA